MKGFTLIELIVAVSIIALLSVFMITNYKEGSTNFDERMSIQNIAQVIRLAQNKALASDCAVAPCRFGVHFDTSSTTIKIFDDANLNNQYDAGEEIETAELEEGISITSLSPSYSCNVSDECLDILFNPPDPTTIFNPTGLDFVTITLTGGSSVVVGRGGSVDIN